MTENIDLGTYIQLFKRRKRYFIIPAVLIFIVSLLVAVILPPVYVSKATILVEAQQIPPEFVRSTVTGFVEQHLQSISQRIMSRSKLVEIIKKLNLYPDARRKMTTEEIVDKMRKAIDLKTVKVKGSKAMSLFSNLSHTIAFTISYKGKNPEIVRKVANVLTSLYLEENLKIRERKATSTTSFLNKEADRFKKQILLIGNRISEFKRKHLTELPESMPLNLRMIENIEKEIGNVSRRIEEIINKKTYLQIQTSSVSSSTIAGGDKLIMDPYTKLKYLNMELISKKALYSEKHPDVIALKKEIKALEKETGGQTESADVIKQIDIKKRELSELSAKFSKNHPDVKAKLNEIKLLKEKLKSSSKTEEDSGNANPAYHSLKMQIKMMDIEMESLKKTKDSLIEELKKHKKSLENMPAVEQKYIELRNESAGMKKKYAEIMNKLMESQISLKLEQSQKAERFTIIDPANYPEKPSWPDRMAIIITGFILALGGGIGAVLAVEYLDSSLRTAAELGKISGMPVLTVIPFIQTEKDKKRAKKRKKIIMITCIVSLLAVLLVFHLLVMDLRIAGVKVLKRFGYYGTFR